MNKFIRSSLAVITGIISIAVLLGIVEFIWLSLFSRPTETYQLKDMPILALFIPFLGLLLTTFISGFISCCIAKSTPKFYASIVGFIILVITGINQIGIPHPIWYTILTFVSIPLTCFLVIRIYITMNNRNQ